MMVGSKLDVKSLRLVGLYPSISKFKEYEMNILRLMFVLLLMLNRKGKIVRQLEIKFKDFNLLLDKDTEYDPNNINELIAMQFNGDLLKFLDVMFNVCCERRVMMFDNDDVNGKRE